MITIEQFSRIVTEVHAAALTPRRWVDALELARSSFGGTASGLISGSQGNRDVRHCTVYDEPAMRAYQEYYCQFDYVLAAVDTSALGLVHSGESLVALEPRSEFHADWMRPYEMDDGLFVRLTSGPMPCCFLVAAPRRGDGFASADNVRAFNALVPHFQQALRTHDALTQLRDQADTRVHPVETIAAAALLVGPDAAVLRHNRAAETLVRDAAEVAVRSGRLRLSLAPADTEFRRAVACATGARRTGTRTGDSLLVPRAGARNPLVVHISPFADNGSDDRPGRALVVIVDPDKQRRPPKHLLRSLFGLTRAEIDVALLISGGSSPSAVADELSLSLATVKTHVQHVYDKTDTHRQAELVRLLLAITP
ncbi:DNA-binding protein with HTH domain [Mycolicibacterium aurum]|uniref:DNA-binding protein with HTH domain n=1 Tax=Mycolicibacterium aurum TaxID=1791 RepID=A0A3S4RXW8_MYCAU|nr:helix-turn-helix transcriptional regulator [Mycolicibacterium aurum]VEG51503.1 DNA-binding protein with HTH domain [Mycolicibacterium aurum]